MKQRRRSPPQVSPQRKSDRYQFRLFPGKAIHTLGFAIAPPNLTIMLALQQHDEFRAEYCSRSLEQTEFVPRGREDSFYGAMLQRSDFVNTQVILERVESILFEW